MTKRFADFRDRATQIVEAGRGKGVDLRSLGGIAVWERMPDGLREEFEGVRDDAKDIDLVAPKGTDSQAIIAVFEENGYVPDERLIAWRGDQRHQYFELDESGQPTMEIDVFLGQPPACHKFDLPGDAFGHDGTALPSTELMLQKLQIVEASDKDLLDIAFLFLAADDQVDGNEIDCDRITGLLSKDWGFSHTTGINLLRVKDKAGEKLGSDRAAQVKERAESLAEAIEQTPKSRKWKLRAKLGTKVAWYEEVEELDR